MLGERKHLGNSRAGKKVAPLNEDRFFDKTNSLSAFILCALSSKAQFEVFN